MKTNISKPVRSNKMRQNNWIWCLDVPENFSLFVMQWKWMNNMQGLSWWKLWMRVSFLATASALCSSQTNKFTSNLIRILISLAFYGWPFLPALSFSLSLSKVPDRISEIVEIYSLLSFLMQSHKFSLLELMAMVVVVGDVRDLVSIRNYIRIFISSIIALRPAACR